ncbi:MAG: PPC domain-containing protein [Chloroflexota bacterium]
MSSRFSLRIAVAFSMLFLLVAGGLAQADRSLVPGVSVDGEVSEAEPAQVYTYVADDADAIKLTLISGDGLALGVLVTDSEGEQVAQGQDRRANGFLVVDNISLEEGGTYFITIFPLAVEDVPTTGEFSISLAQASAAVGNDTDAEDPSTTPDETPETTTDEAATTPVPTPTEEPVVEETNAEPSDSAVADAVAPSQVLTTNGFEVSLTWNASADFNLEVRDPVGGNVFWDSPTTNSGGQFQGFNVNGACETFTANAPTETIAWVPGAVPTGSYEVLVYYVQDCESNGAVPFTVNAVVDGEVLDPIQGTMLPGQSYIASFAIDGEGNATVRENRGVNQGFLPATATEIAAVAAPLSFDIAVEGAITSADNFDSYTFDAGAGDVVSASMSGVSGSLDTFLFLIDGVGNIVAQNDDADGTTRDSQISNAVINTPGTYTLVATRYGQQIGGTEGDYTLTLTGATTGGGNTTEALLGVDLPDGLIEASLVWETNADLQLLIRDPVGDAVFDDAPIIPSGGTLVADANVNCVLTDGTPYYYTYWPVGLQLRPGTYELDVWFQNDCADTTPVSATLTVAVGGQVIISDPFTPTLNENYITTFTIGVDGTVTRGPGGIARGSSDIDYIPALGTAPALTSGVPVQGTITDDSRFDVYTFDGTANEIVNISMDATAGTLDPLVFLIGPTGIELASNDDAIPNETTNSAITEYTLPQTGQYVILATHYGTVYGGTNGSYNLTFSRLNAP